MARSKKASDGASGGQPEKRDPVLDELLKKIEDTEIPDEAKIVELAQMDKLTYAKHRAEIAERLGVRKSDLDELVRDKRRELRQAPDAGDSTAVVEELEPWPEPVEGAELASEIYALIRRHCAMEHVQAVALTLWCFLTYVFQAFVYLPRMQITSPVIQCGKSTVRETMGALVYRALHASNVTTASVFRIMAVCTELTLMLDEYDRWFGEDDLTSIVNAGHTRKGAFVWRVEKVGEELVTKRFNVYRPIMLLGIGPLKDKRGSVEARSIVIHMRRRVGAERVEKVPYSIEQDCLPIRQRLLRWRNDTVDNLPPSGPVPDHPNDRARDNWSGLFAIAAELSDDWLKEAKAAFQALTPEYRDDEDLGPMLLGDLREIFGANEKMKTSEICSRLNELDERPWAELRNNRGISPMRLSELLRPYRVKPVVIRTGKQTPRGYRVDDFRDVFRRYLDPVPDVQDEPEQSPEQAPDVYRVEVDPDED